MHSLVCRLSAGLHLMTNRLTGHSAAVHRCSRTVTSVSLAATSRSGSDSDGGRPEVRARTTALGSLAPSLRTGTQREDILSALAPSLRTIIQGGVISQLWITGTKPQNSNTRQTAVESPPVKSDIPEERICGAILFVVFCTHSNNFCWISSEF